MVAIETTNDDVIQDTEREVASFLSKKLSGRLAAIDMVEKEDLDLVTIAIKYSVIVNDIVTG